MSRWVAAVALVLTVTAPLAGCGSLPAPTLAGTPSRTALTDENTSGAAAAAFCSRLQRTYSVRLPRGFRASAAYECSTLAIVSVPGRGVWLASEERIATGGLARLVKALHDPDQHASGSIFCAAVLIRVPLVALRSRGGWLVRPVVPTDECGQPQAATLTALRALPWRLVYRRLLKQIETPAELASGCSSAFSDLFYLDADSLVAARTGRVIPGRPAQITLCAYRDTDPASSHSDGADVPGKDAATGAFAGWTRLTGRAEHRVLAMLGRGRRRVGCQTPHRSFVVIMPPADASYAVVELGGCDRILRIGQAPGGQPLTVREVDSVGQASTQAVALLRRLTGLR